MANSNKAAAGSISGTTGQSVEVTCDAGYSGSGTATCSTSGTFNSLTCTANPCTSTQVANSNKAAAGSISGTTGQSVEVTCDAGYSGSGTATCSTSGTFNSLTCLVVACPSLTVGNSDTSSFLGSTGDSKLVSCNNGYTSSGGNAYTAICSGTAPGVSAWSNVRLCDAVTCSTLTVANSNTNSFAGSTGTSRVVTCSNGYSSSGGSSFTSTCLGVAPGVSDWSSVLTCTVVSCLPLTVANSDTSNVAGNTLDTHSVTCGSGYEVSTSSISFTSVCTGTSPGVSAWSPIGPCYDTNGCIGNTCANGGDITSICIDVPAPGNGYSCSCSSGFIYNIGTFTCDDENECLTSPCHPSAYCANTIGSFTCTCNGGYFGSGFSCSPSPCDPVFISGGTTNPTDGTGSTGSSLSLTCGSSYLVTPTGVSTFSCVAQSTTPGSTRAIWSPTLSTCTPPIITGITASLLSTSGGDTITLTGTRLGDIGSSVVSATYGPTGIEYSATSCFVTMDNTRIQCVSSVGVGAFHIWKATVTYNCYFNRIE